MKIFKLIFSLVFIIVLSSCEKDELTGFSTAPAINFINDSTQYSFIQEPADEHIVEIPVFVTGDSTSYDRFFNVEVLNDPETTASESQYEIVEGIIPSGSFSGNLKVEVRKSPALDESSVAIKLLIVSSDDFVAGAEESNQTKLIWTNKIVIPAWTYFRYFFTAYPSSRAYRIFIEVTGMTTFSLADYREVGPTGAQALGRAYGDYIRAYNAEHPGEPLVHDDGPNAGEEILPVY
ncbi:DUF4843 domain-containing protein [Leeuwenhoekiella palythoae]|uniref:DUF4843 domain-containing protein n=1 Tax=Leeuwenhoekiella palythoae TaxID=573501 RepID=A0A1M5WPZ4_9FLAO|nr:DUF4843 domain-containing protein [Leeuwenhoekiella palythoae]RXG31471.1 putative protein DUF4843 [Leeuwenhoekiella palythoae]SHH89630.1 protein of unknown function [Leeuwenhoekiella palythoae]